MKTVLAGNSPYLDSIAALFEKEGVEVNVAESPSEARSLVDKYPVVLVSHSEITPFISDRQYAWRLIQNVDPLDTIILLMDKESDSNPYLWKLVLQRAIEIGAGKRHVCVLSRSIGSKMSGLELLYLNARDLGVSFIKYQQLSIEENDDTSQITIDDGTDTYSIITPLLITCTFYPDEGALEYAEALRLRTHDDGKINSDRWFLLRGKTSRRNVFYIDTSLLLSVPLEEIVRSITDVIKSPVCAYDNRAQIEAKKCAFCYTCYRVCPHGALSPDHSAHAMGVLEANCTGCGICVSICPANAIEIIGSSPSTDCSRGDRNVTDERGTIAFCCENSAAIAAKNFANKSDASIVSIPCGGNINASEVVSALGKYERVIIAVCPDNACKHYDGNMRAQLQVEKIKKSLLAINIDPERIKFVQLSHAMPYPLRDALD